jgi:hypothetical protein
MGAIRLRRNRRRTGPGNDSGDWRLDYCMRDIAASLEDLEQLGNRGGTTSGVADQLIEHNM